MMTTLPTDNECLEDPMGSNSRIARWEQERSEAYREAARRLDGYSLAYGVGAIGMQQWGRLTLARKWIDTARSCQERAAFCRRRAEELESLPQNTPTITQSQRNDDPPGKPARCG
jgi:hypothetical protein